MGSYWDEICITDWVWEANCSSCISASGSSRITGINNTFGNNVKINVYPNPAQNMLHISCNTPIGDAQIKMFDMIGHLVYNENLNGSTITKDVDVSNFTKGVYYYQVYSNNKMVAKNKIVVIK